MRDSMHDTIHGAGTVVVGLQGADIEQELGRLIQPEQYVLDLVGLPGGTKLSGDYQGICW
jgi:hypothetical protein